MEYYKTISVQAITQSIFRRLRYIDNATMEN